MIKKSTIFIFLSFVFLWASTGCSTISSLAFTPTPVPPTSTSTPRPTLTPTLTPTPTTLPSPTATATFAIAIPSPAAGKAGAAGLALWNNQPTIYAKVLLCEEFDWGGCTGTEYSTLTNEQGYYVFKNVKPGQYMLVINIPNTDWYIYNIDKKENLEADHIQYFEPVHIFKVDLRPEYPPDQATISEDRPTLKWKIYPEASYYEVTIWTQYFANIHEWQRVETNEYTIQKPLPEGYYIWQLEAFNADGIKISEAEDVHFTFDKP